MLGKFDGERRTELGDISKTPLSRDGYRIGFSQSGHSMAKRAYFVSNDLTDVVAVVREIQSLAGRAFVGISTGVMTLTIFLQHRSLISRSTCDGFGFHLDFHRYLD